AISPGHRRIGPALVDVDQSLRVPPGHHLAEFPPPLLDFRTVLLGGARDLLLARQPELAQGAGDGHGAARGAEVPAAFLERGIGLLSDQLPEAIPVLWPERRGGPPAMRPGLDRAGGE